jgi:hypothetical protein
MSQMHGLREEAIFETVWRLIKGAGAGATSNNNCNGSFKCNGHCNGSSHRHHRFHMTQSPLLSLAAVLDTQRPLRLRLGPRR